jgi:outer membrane protein assembly factor BamB
VNLTTKQVAWEQSGGYTGMPVVGGGVVYAFSAATVTARRESDGALLWTWAPPTQYSTMRSLALTGNTLFVSVGGGYGSTEGATIAVDLTSHLAVWSYPMPGDIALGSQGKLFIVQGPKVAAIALR